MSDHEPWVQVTQHDDGSADVTLTVFDEGAEVKEDFRFSVTPEPETGKALVSYEETLTYRGMVRVRTPDEDVWRLLMQSDEMTDYLESNGNLTGVRRERR